MANMKPLAPWTVLSSERLLACPPWLFVDRQHVRTPSGKDIPHFYMRTGRDSCLIIPMHDTGHTQMVRQYKHGLGRVVVEFPAGYMELGEEPLVCAQRELLEETGYRAGAWTRLGVLAREPHYSPTLLHVFLARQLTRVGAPQPDGTEELSTFSQTWAAVSTMLIEGEMSSVICAAAWALAAPYLQEIGDGYSSTR